MNIPVKYIIAIRVIRGNGVVAGCTLLECLLSTSTSKIPNQYCSIASPKVCTMGSGPVLGGISCRGTEHSVTECSSAGSVGQLNCHHGRDVGVICQGRVGLGVV